MKTITTLAMLAAVLTLAACTAARASTPTPTVAEANAYTPSPGYTAPPPMPSTISSIPDGVYRTRVLKADAVATSGDSQYAGTWTFTLTHGGYTLQCQWTDQDGQDCGNDGYPGEVVVESGPTRGDAAVVYFAVDPAAVSKLNGCSPVEACGTGDPYRLEWKATGDSLVFTNFIGYGDQASLAPVNNFTIQPWTKIG